MLRARDTYAPAIALFLLVFCLFTLPSATAQVTSSSPSDARLESDMVAQVNLWRVSEGLIPLRPNATLAQMAVDQAVYIRSLMSAGQTVNNFHLDAAGLDPQQRAYSFYGWQTYGTPQQIEIGENAAVGSVSFAINYWRTSDIHRRAVLSQTFREVGVAALPAIRGDTLFIIVFGARPGVLPMQTNPERTLLYLNREFSRYSNARVADDPRVRLFAASGQAITPSLSWRSTIPIPATTDDRLFVLFTAEDVQAIAQVDLLADVAVLPETVNLVLTATADAPAFTPTFTPSSTPTLPPNVTPTATLTPPPTLPPTATFTATPIPTNTHTPVPTVAPTDVPDPDMIITYDPNSLIVRVVTTSRPNITGLRFFNTGGTMSVARWLTIAPFPAEAFPQNQCLILYRSGTSIPQPSDCTFVRSAIQLGTNATFWMTAPFDVMLDDQLIRSCPQGTGRCLVKFP